MQPIRSLSGIRGIVGKTMNPLEAYKTTLTFYEQYLKKRGQATLKIILGKDAKASGDNLVFGVKKALKDISKREKRRIEIAYLGITSSPMLQWAVKNYRASGGMNITASHNSIQWNGIKLISREGSLLEPEEMEKINLLLKRFSPLTVSIDQGTLTQNLRKKIMNEYNQDVISKIKKRIDLCSGKKGKGEEIFKKIKEENYKVVIDACSGDGAEIPKKFLISLGLKKENIIIINSNTIENSERRLEPAPQYLSNLKRAIRENKADIGFALDPDQDRLVAMPLRSEEETLLLAGKFLLELQKKIRRKCIAKIPVNLSTSRAWEDLGKEYGVKIIRTPVGEINVAQSMKKHKVPFGGEGNGGVILGEVNYGRNSTVGMALLLAYLAWSGKKLKTLERELPQYILLKEKIRVHSQQNPEEIVERAAAKLASTPKAMSISKRDGYKIFFRDNSWLHLRLSNTEPIIRIFAEGEAKKGKKRVKELVNELKTIINKSSQM